MSTFFVRASGGNDINDGLSFANAWATLQKMADTMVAGDLGLVASDGVHAPTSTVDLDINAGTPSNPIEWRGAGPLGEDDGSIVTLNGASVSPVGAIMRTGVVPMVSSNVWFEGFRFTAGANRNWWVDNNQRGLQFKRCRFDNAVADGFLFNEPNGYVLFIDCEFDNNGGDGIGVQTGASGRIFLVNCLIHDNASHGIDRIISLTMDYCWVYKNGGAGINELLDNPDVQVTNCVFDGNTGDGCIISATTNTGLMMFFNNMITNNGGFGVTHEGNEMMGLIGNNLFFNNTEGEVSFDGIAEAAIADFNHFGTSVDADPLYKDTGDGTEDYRTDAAGPGFEAGYPLTLMDNSTLPGYPNFPHIGSFVPEGGIAAGRIIGG